MANVAGPYGFRPVQSQDNNGFTGKTFSALILAEDVNQYLVGDMVKMTGVQDKHAVDGKFYPVVTLAAASDVDLQGAIVGIKSQELVNNQFAGHRPSGAQANSILVEVPVDRDTLYVVQEDSLVSFIPKDSAGSNVDFVVGAGNIPGRTSTTALDSDSVAPTATLPIRLVSYDGAIDNEAGNFASWYVTINLDAQSNTTGIV